MLLIDSFKKFTAIVMLAGAGAMIEMVYHLQMNAAMGSTVKFLGVVLDAKGINSWVGSAFVMLTGLGLFELARHQYSHDWGAVQQDIEREIKRRDAL